MDHVEILENALRIVEIDPNRPALDAINEALGDADVLVRKRVNAYFQNSLLRPETGTGPGFQASILDRAVRMAKRDDPDRARPSSAPERGQRQSTKGYVSGSEHVTVASLGLKPTEEGALCHFQFSRKTGHPGVMDLPSGTRVVYKGVSVVHADRPSSKKMIFSVPAGTRAIVDGQEISLDHDIDVAGVSNHVDKDDPYNNR